MTADQARFRIEHDAEGLFDLELHKIEALEAIDRAMTHRYQMGVDCVVLSRCRLPRVYAGTSLERDAKRTLEDATEAAQQVGLRVFVGG